ncbi:PLP-dependent aminotransferase family protein [Paenibacillus sp. YYML68]|uniref:MocR-like pyridoxine biosynthesis transcription factor PdxR n=1 Tax=Paenibacillus sp. YYML68 TaxID=2909250 RepID=UPI002490F9D2|nr:PLP-dependent aminotransferase family protein [Paenibacillus sp. YYML68]
MQFHVPFDSYCLRYATKSDALYYALKDGIVEGVWPRGTRLPSTRELAGQLSLSRGTVSAVYETLAAEGYVSSKVGQGTVIVYQSGVGRAEEPMARPELRLTAWASRLERLHGDAARAGGRAGVAGGTGDSLSTNVFEVTGASPCHASRPKTIDFSKGHTDMSLFPDSEWSKWMHTSVRASLHRTDDERSSRQQVTAQGSLSLREAIAAYLGRARGMRVKAEQVAIVHGSMQAIALIVQLMLEEGDAAVVETPGYSGIRRSIRAAGGRLLEGSLDEQGIVPADWDARLLFVTPSRQFPTGVVLSLERRQALLAWAARRGAVIVEDDYDSEFRHKGRSLEPLQVLDRDGRVIYVGSFTKTMPPGLRIGYAVLPERLVAPFVMGQSLYEPYPANALEQQALAAFMTSGGYERHLRRMKRVYSRRYEALSGLLSDRLVDRFEWVPSDAGLHLFGWWRGTEQAYIAYRDACRRRGVYWAETVVQEAGTEEARWGAYFHFSDVEEAEMREAIDRIVGMQGVN